jgi:hypothetical protein
LSYKDAKDYLYEKTIAFLKPIQEKYATISDEEILAVLKKNADVVRGIAEKKIAEVYKKVGFSLN